MKKIFYSILALITHVCFVQAQENTDGYFNIELNAFRNTEEAARESVRLLPGFSTEGQSNFRAYIDPELPYNGGIPVEDGVFTLNQIRIYTPINDNATQEVPTHESLNYEKWAESITYFDGLGRKIQSTQVKQSPIGADIVTPITYDQFGRKEKEYLSYAIIQDGANGPGGYRPEGEQEVKEFHTVHFGEQDGAFPFTQNQFEESPLNRVLRKSNPGYEYRLEADHVKHFSYNTNTSGSNVFSFSVTDNGFKKEGVYDAGTLVKNIVSNENAQQNDGNAHKEITYTDKNGNTILVQSFDGNAWLNTYYIYDNYGLLRYVLPPEADNLPSGSTPIEIANTDDWVKQYCYYYEYDDRYRLKKKRLPGQDMTYYVYDRRDRLVLTQYPEQRSDGEWVYNKYDYLNRVVLDGVYRHESVLSQEDMQAHLTSFNANIDDNQLFEEYDQTHLNDGGYTNICFPHLDFQGFDIIHNITYYDNYAFLNHSSNDGNYDFQDLQGIFDFNYPKSDRTNGLVTGKVTYVNPREDNASITDDRLLNVFYFDKYGNTIQTISDNHFGNTDIVSNQINFTGQRNASLHTHERNSEVINLRQDYSYDRMGRKTSESVTLNDLEPVQVSLHEYNETGQLETKSIQPSGVEGNALQYVDYSYNIRGWLTNINEEYQQGVDYFSLNLKYEEGADPQFNGNISEMTWLSDFVEKQTYEFTYDDVSRLKGATYYGRGDHSVTMEYDKNGNISTLNRSGYISGEGMFGSIDQLTYSYRGNQLMAVNDNPDLAFQTEGFVDNGIFENEEYGYDKNGNMVMDRNKNIGKINYTWNNLPESIFFVSSKGVDEPGIITYIYDANGNKLMKETSINKRAVSKTHYSGPFVYSASSLSFIQMGDYRIVPEGDGYEFQYYLKDHLGNNQIVFNDQGEVLQDNSYYPFGMRMEFASFDANESPENKYLYNGKELQDDFGLDWYDYGARMYDAHLGRWHVVDPMAEEYDSQSPYHFSGNNPLKFVDLNGMNYDGYTMDKKGDINRVDDTGGDEYDVLYTEEDYNQAKLETKETGEKNQYGNPEPGNSVEVSKGTFSESNKFTLKGRKGSIKGLNISNESDAMAVYSFAANNLPVEVGLVKGGFQNGTMSAFHTSGEEGYSETASVAKYLKDKGGLILETHHSQPDIETPSGFYSNGQPKKPLKRETDAASAKYINKMNAHPAKHYMYHPKSGKTYQYNQYRYEEVK